MFHFPAGLEDFLKATLAERDVRHRAALRRRRPSSATASGRVEWAIAWPLDEEPYIGLYCNTVPTPQGGSHEQALRSAAAARAARLWRAHRQPRRSPRSPPTTCSAAPARCSRCSSRTRSSRARPRSGWSRPRPAARSRPALKDHFDHWLSRPRRGRPRAARARARPRRGAPRAQARQGGRAQDRDPQAAPARQARRLLDRRPRAAPRSSWSRAIPPAARPSRRASARPRRSCRCAARS